MIKVTSNTKCKATYYTVSREVNFVAFIKRFLQDDWRHYFIRLQVRLSQSNRSQFLINTFLRFTQEAIFIAF